MTRREEWGDRLARHLSLLPGTDFPPLCSRDLPGDVCDCPRGLHYWPGCHTSWTDEGVTFLEFSRAAELRPVLKHIDAQLANTR